MTKTVRASLNSIANWVHGNFDRCILISECTFLVLNKEAYEQTKDEIGNGINKQSL